MLNHGFDYFLVLIIHMCAQLKKMFQIHVGHFRFVKKMFNSKLAHIDTMTDIEKTSVNDLDKITNEEDVGLELEQVCPSSRGTR